MIYKKDIKKAFTLAEVVIILVTIGVVSIMTIRSVVVQTFKNEMMAALKTCYAAIQSAYSLAIVEHGDPSTWGLIGMHSPEGAVNLTDKLITNLNYAKYCKGEAGCFGEEETQYMFLDGRPKLDSYGGHQYSEIKLTNDMNLAAVTFSGDCSQDRNNTGGNIKALQNVCAAIDVDVNGPSGPNTVGKDIFAFYLNKEGRVVPAGIAGDRVYGPRSGNYCSKEKSEGWGCTAWIIYNKNLDYLN